MKTVLINENETLFYETSSMGLSEFHADTTSQLAICTKNMHPFSSL